MHIFQFTFHKFVQLILIMSRTNLSYVNLKTRLKVYSQNTNNKYTIIKFIDVAVILLYVCKVTLLIKKKYQTCIK